MIDLFSEASAIARNMLSKYLNASPEIRDQMPGASIARDAWDRVERELLKEGMVEVVKSSKNNPGNIPYDLPGPLMKLMKMSDDFAGELRQLYDRYLMESSSKMINVKQEVDTISGTGKIKGVSFVETSIGPITGTIISSSKKPPSETQSNED